MSPIARTLAGLALTTTLSTAVAAQGAGHAEKHFLADGADDSPCRRSPSAKAWDSRFRFRSLDRAGLPIVMLRDDGAGLHTPEGAERKALHGAHVPPAVRAIRQTH